MKKWQKTASSMIIAAFCALPATAQDAPTAGTVVASIDGTEITLGHLILAFDSLPDEYKSLPSDQLFQGLIEQMIQQTLLSNSAKNKDAAIVRLALENEKRLLQAGVAVNELTGEVVTEDAIRAAYDAQFANVDLGMEYNAAHILVETEDTAKELIEKLADGADFAALAQEFSTGPSGPSGGDLGWFNRGDMVGPFDAAIADMQVGDIAGPVQTQFGWHVISLKNTRAKSAPEYDTVKGDIAVELQRQAVQDRVTSLTQSATITRMTLGDIDSNLIKDPTFLEQ